MYLHTVKILYVFFLEILVKRVVVKKDLRQVCMFVSDELYLSNPIKVQKPTCAYDIYMFLPCCWFRQSTVQELKKQFSSQLDRVVQDFQVRTLLKTIVLVLQTIMM